MRVAQLKLSDSPEKSLALAKCFVIGKVLNCRNILQRRIRDHGENDTCRIAVDKLASIIPHIKSIDNHDSLRGYEGTAAEIYFDSINELFLAQKDAFHFQKRTRRPPLDPINALLSFLYTLLAHECECALEAVGLDPQIGFLHGLRPGRSALALDIMEEFRAPLADRLAFSLINLKQIGASGFKVTESGAVVMDDSTRKIVLTSWQNKKQEELQHPFLNEKVKIGLLPYIQAMLLARFIRGDLDLYPPFLLK